MRIRILGRVEAAVIRPFQSRRPCDFCQFGRIPAVASQDGTGDSHFPSLLYDFRDFFIISRDIQGIRIGGFQFGECRLEILILGQKGFLRDDFSPFFFQGLGKHFSQPFGIIAGGIVVDGHPFHFQLIHRKSGQDLALEWIREADPENIGTHFALFIHGDAWRCGRRRN